MDYGKFQYQKSKKANLAKKKQQIILVKEVKLRPNTDEHDFLFKQHHAERFLNDGNKAKISVMFKGREMMHTERGKKMLVQMAEKLSEVSTIEQMPKLEGRNMTMILIPKPVSATSKKKTEDSKGSVGDAKNQDPQRGGEAVQEDGDRKD